MQVPKLHKLYKYNELYRMLCIIWTYIQRTISHSFRCQKLILYIHQTVIHIMKIRQSQKTKVQTHTNTLL